MHLHGHQAIQFAAVQPVMSLDHGLLDGVGGDALQGLVKRGAPSDLSAVAVAVAVAVAAIECRQVEAAARLFPYSALRRVICRTKTR